MAGLRWEEGSFALERDTVELERGMQRDMVDRDIASAFVETPGGNIALEIRLKIGIVEEELNTNVLLQLDTVDCE